MIERYNSRQKSLAVLNFVLGLLATAVTFGFFAFAVSLICSQMRWESATAWPWIIASLATIVVFVTGISEFRRGGGFYEFSESDLFLSIDHSTGGGTMMDLYGSRITGPAYLLTQLFLAAPLQICKGVSRLRGLVTAEPGLEEELSGLLGKIREEGKWHSIRIYSGKDRLLAILVQMEEILFSPRKASIRIAT